MFTCWQGGIFWLFGESYVIADIQSSSHVVVHYKSERPQHGVI